MDDEEFKVVAARQPALNLPLVKCWKARLNLDFKLSNDRSYLAKNLHVGPLVLQKSLHPEGAGVCHGVVVHPPGGVAGGDELALYVEVDKGAHALLTTPGAGKWYKANGQHATQHLAFNLHENACFEWLPQENILFDGAKVKFSADVNLASKAKYAAWEIQCFGRQAQAEGWKTGAMLQNFRVRREGKLIWNECAALVPASHTFKSILGLHGNVVSASFVVVAGQVPSSIIDACRAIKPKQTLDANAKYGVTALPEVFSARYVGQSSQCAREYFEKLWQQLRPWYAGKAAVRPRIWNT